MTAIPVKVLGYKHSQRYPILRILSQAQRQFENLHPEVRLDIQEVCSTQEILRYTPVIAFPSLLVGETLVCVGRSPKREEVLGWLETAIAGRAVDERQVP
jgi:hypothetical protein